MSFEAAVHAQAIEIDRLSLEMTAASGTGHPTSAMSIGHIVTTLMFSTMRWSPDYPNYPTSDRLVLSEGHAVPAVYAAMATLGVMVGKEGDRRKLTTDDLSTLREWKSVLDGHPKPNGRRGLLRRRDRIAGSRSLRRSRRRQSRSPRRHRPTRLLHLRRRRSPRRTNR